MRAETNMNQGKSDIIAKWKVKALFRIKQKYKYDNSMQIKLTNINDVTIKRKRSGLIRVKSSAKYFDIVLWSTVRWNTEATGCWMMKLGKN